MTKKQELKSKVIDLLSSSALPEPTCEGIKKFIDKFTVKQLEDIIESLEREKIELDKIDKEIAELEEKSNQEWLAIKDKQQKIADQFVDQSVEQIIKELENV